jgi:hypothetical protein
MSSYQLRQLHISSVRGASLSMIAVLPGSLNKYLERWMRGKILLVLQKLIDVCKLHSDNIDLASGFDAYVP